MTAASIDLASFAIVREDWPHADSLADLASIYEELRRLDTLDRVVIRHLRGLETQKEIHDDLAKARSQEHIVSYRHSDAWRGAAQCIDQQREALRSRAAFLSRGQRRDVRLSDLSVELHLLIVSHFQYSVSIHDTEKGVIHPFSDSDRLAVQSLRLVSRLFNTLASPLLYPVIQLSVDNKSLDRLQCVSSNPLIASGIRAIRVGLEYRPTVLARRFDSWREHSLEGLGTRLLTSEIAQNACRRRKYKESGNEKRFNKYHEQYQNLQRAMNRANLVRRVMREWADTEDTNAGSEQEQEALPGEVSRRCRELIRESHKEYVRVYEEQARLVTERSFISAIVRLAVQARQPIALELFDSKICLPKRASTESRTVFRSDSVLSSHLASAVRGPREFIEDEEPQHLAASIVSDLPVAIQQAGVILNAFQLNCPIMIHHLSATTCSFTNDWEGVHAAYQHLEVFSMSQILLDFYNPSPFLPETQRKSVERYFAALFSSKCLEEAFIDGTPYLGLSRFDMSGPLWSSLGTMLGRISWPQIRRVKISQMTMTQIQVEGLLLGLGTNLEEITLDKIHLLSGSWIRAMDILRDKMTDPAGCLKGNRPIRLTSLTGGGITEFLNHQDPGVIDDYVNGQGPANNPLLKLAIS